jgi:hypothetical protein
MGVQSGNRGGVPESSAGHLAAAYLGVVSVGLEAAALCELLPELTWLESVGVVGAVCPVLGALLLGLAAGVDPAHELCCAQRARSQAQVLRASHDALRSDLPGAERGTTAQADGLAVSASRAGRCPAATRWLSLGLLTGAAVAGCLGLVPLVVHYGGVDSSGHLWADGGYLSVSIGIALLAVGSLRASAHSRRDQLPRLVIPLLALGTSAAMAGLVLAAAPSTDPMELPVFLMGAGAALAAISTAVMILVRRQFTT